MIKGAQLQDEYYGGQAVEVRNVHNGRETWRPAKIHRRTSRGCEVVYRDGRDQRPQHIMLSDLRPMEKTGRPSPQVTTPALTAADIDAFNKRMDDEARARDAKPPQQQLVLVRKPQPVLQGARPAPRLMRVMRQARKAKTHHATPLSKYLRDARLVAGLQQRVLSERSGVSQPRLSHIELGDIPSTDDDLLGLSIALNLDIDHLLKLRDEKPSVIETHGDEAPRVHALPLPVPPPPPPPPRPAPLTLLEDIRTPPRPVAARGSERRDRDRESDDTARLLQEIATLRSENLVLRDAVVFYAGMDRP